MRSLVWWRHSNEQGSGLLGLSNFHLLAESVALRRSENTHWILARGVSNEIVVMRVCFFLLLRDQTGEGYPVICCLLYVSMRVCECVCERMTEKKKKKESEWMFACKRQNMRSCCMCMSMREGKEGERKRKRWRLVLRSSESIWLMADCLLLQMTLWSYQEAAGSLVIEPERSSRWGLSPPTCLCICCSLLFWAHGVSLKKIMGIPTMQLSLRTNYCEPRSAAPEMKTLRSAKCCVSYLMLLLLEMRDGTQEMDWRFLSSPTSNFTSYLRLGGEKGSSINNPTPSSLFFYIPTEFPVADKCLPISVSLCTPCCFGDLGRQDPRGRLSGLLLCDRDGWTWNRMNKYE